MAEREQLKLRKEQGILSEKEYAAKGSRFLAFRPAMGGGTVKCALHPTLPSRPQLLGEHGS
jgi:hypothetical protein